MTLSEELLWRGFVNQTTLPDPKMLDSTKRTFYWGVDPSAPSMQVGNLAAAMLVRVFIKHGYTPILLVGGATGLIGDPDGKAQERDLKSIEEIAKNKKAIASQYEKIFGGLPFKIVDNYSWFKDLGYLDFLRTVGKHVPMRQMLNREFVRERVSEGGAGISYAEFSYSLIQGYDFLYLFENHGVTLQVAGSDQWGNSIAGVDLIRRKTGKEAHVWTAPLIVNKATGVKFGKTEDGAVWLDSNLTSVYQFYQFWLNVDDEGVEDYLKVYTTLSKQDIDHCMHAFKADTASRSAQRTLAYEVTKIVHGKKAAEMAGNVTKVLFGGDNFLDLTTTEVTMLKKELPVVKYDSNLLKMVVEAGFASSNSEARRLVEAGALKINEDKIAIGQSVLLGANHNLLMKKGKNNFAIIEK